ncbi:trypsin-like peptidase domain-containing protein [Coprococcus comes]|uniref:S1C family serine protease n=1 Tax=Coprococcus comes TaxID=410072 RepID=UPI001D05E4D0|nr:trypsin-like peptidase domain-containing protein [Coprococcus comes]MCB6468671.1 trypsin-like peptidase domain-containing protein [Coprococcus comes]
MDNQYNYYRPDSDENRGAGNQQGFGAGPQKDPKTSKPKKGYMKKVALVVGAAVLFGAVGGVTMQGTSYLTGKLLGKNTKSTVGTTKTVSNAKLTTSTSTVTSDVSDIVENTLPSIVSITNMSVQEVQNFFGGISQQESESAGSGIIISQNDSELLVVTNNHVVEGSDTLTVTFNDGNSVEAQIKGTDSARDLAVVAVPLDKISDDTMNAIKVATLGDSDSLKVGEPAIAIGNALGYGQSVTTGIVSATGRTIDGFDGEYIQTDAAINPGNSGGALLNANGEVIGINSAKINSSAVEGMGFAIPISDASDVIQNLMNKETRSKVSDEERGYLGIKGYDVSEEGAQMYNMPTGVYVKEVMSGDGAEKAGLTKGSIITGFEGSSISGMSSLQEQLQYYKAGEEVTLTVQIPDKNGEYTEKDIKVTLGKNS